MQYNSLLPLGGEVSFAPNSGIFPQILGHVPQIVVYFLQIVVYFPQMVCAGIIIVLFRSSFFVSDFAR